MNTINVQQNQTQKHVRYVVPESERIAVKAGDIIGWASQFLVYDYGYGYGYDGVYCEPAEYFSLTDNNEYHFYPCHHPFFRDMWDRGYAIHATVEPIEGILLLTGAFHEPERLMPYFNQNIYLFFKIIIKL